MEMMPDALLEALDVSRRVEVEAWWSMLPEAARRDFVGMWDRRAEDTAWAGYLDGERLVWQELPIELVGELVDDDVDFEHDELKQNLLEYINNHEEVQFFLLERELHICRAHASARKVLTDGFLPADFVCPLGASDCPMRTILIHAGGKSVMIRARVKTSLRVATKPEGSRCSLDMKGDVT